MNRKTWPYQDLEKIGVEFFTYGEKTDERVIWHHKLVHGLKPVSPKLAGSNEGFGGATFQGPPEADFKVPDDEHYYLWDEEDEWGVTLAFAYIETYPTGMMVFKDVRNEGRRFTNLLEFNQELEKGTIRSVDRDSVDIASLPDVSSPDCFVEHFGKSIHRYRAVKKQQSDRENGVNTD
jgi:hypothetical protein